MTRPARRWLALLSGLLALSCTQPATPTVPAGPAAAGAPPPAAPKPPVRPPVKPGTVTVISITGFFPLQQAAEALVFDVRPGIFHTLGHIPGSANWPKARFDAGLAAHEPDLRAAARDGRPVVLYCTDRACPDARTVADRLAALGHSVAILEGGYDEWKAAGLPTE